LRSSHPSRGEKKRKRQGKVSLVKKELMRAINEKLHHCFPPERAEVRAVLHEATIEKEGRA